MIFIKTLLDEFVYRTKEAPKGLDFARSSYPYDAHSDHIWYERTAPRHAEEIFSCLSNKNLPVLDIGCGKGFVLAYLKQQGFSVVDGVECNEELATICRNNMEQLGYNEVQVFHKDIRGFFGMDDYQIIYLFHPFKARIMAELVSEVEQSLVRYPREFTVIYANPVERMFWDRSPLFVQKKKKTLAYLNREMDVLYYEHNPSFKAPQFKEILQQCKLQ